MASNKVEKYELRMVKQDLEHEISVVRAQLQALWAKHERLLEYLELEDVVIPEQRLVRKNFTPTNKGMEK